jgi:AcrR family transcriptional regulator
MQVKKEYTHEHILEVAKRVFLRKGYSKTSMRDIAKGAGIGVSNIYNYFKSKDDLFRYIVMPLVTELETMMYEHHKMSNQESFMNCDPCNSEEMIAKNVQEYLRLINNHRDEFKMLLYQAQGSSLENYIDTYTESCSNLVLDFMEEFKKKYPDCGVICSPFTYHVHIVWMFSFISEMIKHELSSQEMKEAIEDYIKFEFSGWLALMNQKKK